VTDPTPRILTIVAHEVRINGGMERAQFEVITGLLERGWEIQLLARACDLAPHKLLRWRRIRTPRRPFAFAYPAFAVVASAVLARRRRGPVVALGAIVFNRVDVMTVQFCHHGFAAHQAQRAQRASMVRRLNDRLGSKMTLVAERWCMRQGRVRHFTPVSSLVASEIDRHFSGVAESTVIPNGTDTDHFRPDPERRHRVRRRLGIGEDELVALFVGGDWQRKGLAVAIAAAGKAGWRVLVAGAGDPARYAPTIKAAGAAVDFLGMIDDPASVFSSADAFLLPSSYEGFALVAIEAAASGLPVLVTEATGAAALALAGGGRVLPRDETAFADALREIGQDVALRRQMGVAARDAARGLAWPNIVDRYEAVYRDAAASVDSHSTPTRG
jgi:UDP-glucose:(heptosyl)LPS alpha-1,3-glucosyltransferase